MRPLASTRAATEVLAGLIERVTFHNQENGFCVLRVKARGQRDLTADKLLAHSRLPLAWHEQRSVLGFA